MLRSRTIVEGGLTIWVLERAGALSPELLEFFAIMDATVRTAQEELREEKMNR